MASLTVISSAISATSDAFCSSCELTTSSSYSSAAYFSNRKVIFYNGERSFRGCALRKKYVSAVASTFSQPAKALVPEKSVSVILLAGGKGKRMGASIPKQYLPLLGQPIVLYSFHTLSDVAEVKEIIVACDPSYQKLFEDASSNLVPVLKFASPGEERQDSVFNGLKEVDDAAELVCVHDSARPLVSSESVKQVLQDAWVHGAAVLGVPVKATIKEVVTDNAASFVAAGRILMASYPTIYWTPCAAHCLDLLLEDIGKINWISMVVRRAKIICKFIYMNSHVRHLFLEFSKGVEIVRPATTRFATNFILLESIQSHKGNLMNMFVSEKYRNDERFARARRLPMGKVAKRAIWDETQFWHGVRNCILASSDGFVVKTLKRETLWEMQTPQVMKTSLLRKGFEIVNRDGLVVTDDVSIVEHLKQPVYITQGSYTNIKVTTPDDLIMAETILNKS